MTKLNTIELLLDLYATSYKKKDKDNARRRALAKAIVDVVLSPAEETESERSIPNEEKTF